MSIVLHNKILFVIRLNVLFIGPKYQGTMRGVSIAPLFSTNDLILRKKIVINMNQGNCVDSLKDKLRRNEVVEAEGKRERMCQIELYVRLGVGGCCTTLANFLD